MSADERLLRKFEQKSWSEVKSKNSWQVFRIMAEFVEGFDLLNELGPSVTLFGSARMKTDSRYYRIAHVLGKRLARKGLSVITGGGPGLMEAANKGATEAGGISAGVGVELPFEDSNNPYISKDKNISLRYFFVRKLMFLKYSQAFVALPGGMGTMDELFEALTLAQTGKAPKFPIILVGRDYWQGLVDWMKVSMLKHETISAGDLDMFRLADDADEIMAMITAFFDKYRREMVPNF